MGRGLALVVGLCFSFVLAACSSNDSPAPASRDVPFQTKATKENYLSGDAFCQLYHKITDSEVAVRVSVPKSYDHPEQGSLTIYAYTSKPFDPAKPSYIFVDGGPGQNTHGMMADYLLGAVNEIRFDQRGLGCSAPATWDDYTNAQLYSSANNVRDMDEIRKAYGIQKWSIYGLSYGTAPATMYGSRFTSQTTSVVLEGVIGDTSLLHDAKYKADKLNLMLNQLTPAQHESFSTVLLERDASGNSTVDSRALTSYMYQFFYSDKGMSKFAEHLNTYIDPTGYISRANLAKLRENSAERRAVYSHPQQPGAVDENIFTIIQCRDLAARHKPPVGVAYSVSSGFYVRSYAYESMGNECDEAGVHESDETPFRPENYPTSVPVYYFQGAYDGATIAIGAIKNWQAVPKGKSYFMLAEKGGHNPNLNRLESDNPAIVQMERHLFSKAIAGAEITQDEVNAEDIAETPDQHWMLYLSPNDPAIATDLDGIGLIR